MWIYVVKPGDNVDKIAAEAGIPVEKLIEDNQIEYPYRLAVGEALYISDGSKDQSYLLYSSGYAYPFIDNEVLGQTLPYLTDIYVFSYGFTEEGDLVPPLSDDTRLVNEALAGRVRPILTLTPLGPDGRFNNNLISSLLASPQAKERLIWQLGEVLLTKGFRGIDVDFEYVKAEDRGAYVEFVGLLKQVLGPFGYEVSVALAPKTSSEQRGLLYEGIDYRLLGQKADRVMLMTYEWGYSQGPPMAVAPLNMVRRVVEYAVTQITPGKIVLGIPNYGYDWPLPYERGVTTASTLGTREAVQLAVDHGAEIFFDQTAMSPYFHYWQYGIRHEVWFEDVRSIQAKFRLIREFGLSGAGYWQLMRFFRANWVMMEDEFLIDNLF